MKLVIEDDDNNSKEASLHAAIGQIVRRLDKIEKTLEAMTGIPEKEEVEYVGGETPVERFVPANTDPQRYTREK